MEIKRLSPVILLAELCGGALLGWAGATLLAPAPSGRFAAPRMQLAAASPAARESAGEASRLAAEPAPSALAAVLSPKSPEFDRALLGAASIVDNADRAMRLREILRGVPADELPAAFEKIKKLAGAAIWQSLIALGHRWAEIDPLAAAEVAQKAGKVGPYRNMNPMLNGVVERWANLDPVATAAWIESLPPGNARNDSLGTLIFELGKTDPHAALKLLKTSSLRGSGSGATTNLFGIWAIRDPQSAAAATLELNGDYMEEAARAVAESWALADPAKAMAWAADFPQPSARKTMMGSIAQHWAEVDAHAEIDWARGLADESMRREQVAKGIQRLAAEDLPAALDQISALPAGVEHDTALQAAAVGVGAKDARGGLTLLAQLPACPTRASAIAELCRSWGQTDPRSALDWQFRNAPPIKDGYGLRGTIQTWMTKALQDAIAWAQALPAGDNRDSALVAIVNGLTETDFARAQTLFEQLPPEAQAAAASPLIDNLLKQNTDKARGWAEALPPGPAQNEAFQAVARQWTAQDPDAAAQWLGTLPAGPGLDSAIGSFSKAAFARDPEGALDWVQTIGDADSRNRQTEDLVGQWLQTDSTAARAWLDANPQITPEEKTRILNQ